MPISSPAFSVELIRESDHWNSNTQECIARHANHAYHFLLLQHPTFTAKPFSLVLADDAMIQRLNTDWRDKNQPTNVLAFPAAALPEGIPEEGTLGDVIMAFETAQDEARGLNIDLAEHATHLMIHGLLHLLGHNHFMDTDRQMMEDWEIRTLAELGYSNPYA